MSRSLLLKKTNGKQNTVGIVLSGYLFRLVGLFFLISYTSSSVVLGSLPCIRRGEKKQRTQIIKPQNTVGIVLFINNRDSLSFNLLNQLDNGLLGYS